LVSTQVASRFPSAELPHQKCNRWLGDPGSEKSQRTTKAMPRMKKIDLETLRQACEGTA